MAINVDDAKVNYKNIRYTAKGNPYLKSNTGKLVGTVGFGLMPVVSFIKNKNLIKDTYTQVTQRSQEFLKENGVQANPKELASSIKSISAAAAGVTVAASALAGLAVGAVVDFAINKFKAHKANKENAAQKA